MYLRRKLKVLIYKLQKVRLTILWVLYTIIVFQIYNAVVNKNIIYFSNELQYNKTFERNLSYEYICRNNYAPVKEAGKNGEPLELSSGESVFAKGLYAFQGYNVLASDRIPINRSLPDMRSDSCRKMSYEIDSSTTASIIVVFYNEVWSALMRTVMSIVNNSNDQLLKEIILVDDGSERRYLGQELDHAIANLAKVRVQRIKVRKGLVGARLIGARAASGHVLVFLDAHCEVTVGWLEPLLYRAANRNVFTCPHINNIHDDTLEFSNNIAEQYGTFNWKLAFRWSKPSNYILKARAKNDSLPYPTPVMAGGLFAVKRRLFWDIGSYDDGLQIWGAENIELSWRAWQCGARIEVDPCSRVGHIFRTKSPYNFAGVKKVHLSNLARIALVWMDKWANFVFKINPKLNSIKNNINVTHRIDLRKKLKCHAFEWYLKNVWPTHYFPTEDRWFGKIKNKRGACLGLLKGTAFGVDCNYNADSYQYLLFGDGKIMGNEDSCLEQGNGRVFWNECKEIKKQVWRYDNKRLKTGYGACLTLIKRETSKTGGIDDLVSVKRCIEDKGQIWYLITTDWH